MSIRYFPQQFFHGGGGGSGHANKVGVQSSRNPSGQRWMNISGHRVLFEGGLEHIFGNGTGSPDADKFTFKADTYLLENGTTLYFKQGMDPSKQTLTPEQLVTAIYNLDNRVFSNMQKSIEVVDYENPQDAYWRGVYKNFSSSYMTGGTFVTIYKHGTQHNDDYLVESISHEIGHGIDSFVSKKHLGLSNSKKWADAVAADNIHTKKLIIKDIERRMDAYRDRAIKNGATQSDIELGLKPYRDKIAQMKKSKYGLQAVSTYGMNSPAEDFADSISHYSIGTKRHTNYNASWSVQHHEIKGSFSEVFPNRTAIIEEVLNNGTIDLT